MREYNNGKIFTTISKMIVGRIQIRTNAISLICLFNGPEG